MQREQSVHGVYLGESGRWGLLLRDYGFPSQYTAEGLFFSQRGQREEFRHVS